MKDFDKFRREHALYTPAASPAYVKPMSLPQRSEQMKYMNWLNKDAPWHYPWSLYSAGHAFMDIKVSDEREAFIQKRDREHSIIIGDSGGYQIATGKLKFDWDNFEGTHDPTNKKVTRIQLLRWLEHTSDLATTLDYPTWALSGGKNKTTPLQTAKQCFEGTKENLDFFIKHRDKESNTRFLNVLQGRDQEESDAWYDMVKDYDFEGWALAGPSRIEIGKGLSKLLRMRDDKMFEGNRDWIHVLGVSKLSAGMALTALQKAMRKHVNEKLQFSYDSASPFLMAAFGSSYYGYEMNKNKLRMLATKTPKDKELLTCDQPWPWSNPISDKVNISELVGEKQKHLWTLDGYLFQMYCNTYQICTALQETNSLYLTPGNTLKKFIPEDILKLESILDEVFKSETPHTVIDRYASWLDNVISKELSSRTPSFFEAESKPEYLLDQDDDQDLVERMQDAGSRADEALIKAIDDNELFEICDGDIE